MKPPVDRIFSSHAFSDPCMVCFVILFICAFLSSTADRIDPLLQFKTLKEFYDATGGPNWKNNTGWLDGPPCGKDWRLPGNTPWHGLICNMDNAVTNINLINVCLPLALDGAVAPFSL